jgi:hypothetical protein
VILNSSEIRGRCRTDAGSFFAFAYVLLYRDAMNDLIPPPNQNLPIPFHIKIRIGLEFVWLWLSNPKFRARADKRRAFYEHMMVKAHRIWFC